MNNIVDEAETYDFEDPTKTGPTGDQLASVLQEAGVIITNGMGDSSGMEVAKKYTNDDGTINSEMVYKELAELIASGNAVVKNLKFIDPNLDGVLSGMASVLASVRQMIADFAKIHSDYIKHKQRIELEEFKEKSKLRILERKHQMDLEKLSKSMNQDGIPDDGDGVKKLGYSQKDIVRQITEAANSDL